MSRTSSPVDLVGVGANSLDLVYTLPDYPEADGPRSKLRIQSAVRSPGGQTATVLAGCAALGLTTRYVGTMARDPGGELVRDALLARGVDVSGAIGRDGTSPYAVILLADRESGSGRATAGERIVLWDRPEGMALEPGDVPEDVAAGARAMFVDDVDVPAAIVAARRGRAAGIPVASDIEKVVEGTDDLFAAVTIPIFAAHVPSQLTGEADPERALRVLRERHAGPLVVTLGDHGAIMMWENHCLKQPGFAVDAVDTTGAGDLFRAGFLYGLLQAFAPADLLRFACAAAAVSCTRRGAIASAPGRAEVEALLGRQA